MHIIRIQNAEFFAYHGVHPEEQKIGGKFTVDLSLETDFTKAAEEDDLNGTVDYAAVYEIIETEMKIQSKLIENLAYRIVQKLKKEFPKIHSIKIEVSKHKPPISGNLEKVSVVIEE